MADRDELRAEFMDEFSDADYPVNSPMDLVPALSNGPGTTFESGDVSISAMELNQKGDPDFPYESPDDLVDDIMDGLEDEGYL